MGLRAPGPCGVPPKQEKRTWAPKTGQKGVNRDPAAGSGRTGYWGRRASVFSSVTLMITCF